MTTTNTKTETNARSNGKEPKLPTLGNEISMFADLCSLVVNSKGTYLNANIKPNYQYAKL